MPDGSLVTMPGCDCWPGQNLGSVFSSWWTYISNGKVNQVCSDENCKLQLVISMLLFHLLANRMDSFLVPSVVVALGLLYFTVCD